MERSGVVSIFDPTQFEIEWRDIPGYSNYLASSIGTLKHIRLNRICNFYETKTSNGTYLASGSKDDAKQYNSRGTHILICMAFHGLPPTNKHEVNHKDGNKHNNLPDNLEWVTRGENIQHAYREGLRKENRKVVMTDVLTGEETLFYSMNELGRHVGLTKNEIWTFVIKHKDILYKDRYTFKFILGETRIADRPSTKTIYAYNYHKKTLHVFGNLAECELSTGIKRGKAYWHLSRESTSLVKGYILSYDSTFKNFPKYTDEEIDLSIAKTSTGKGKAIRVTDTEANTTKSYVSIPALARDIGIKHNNTIHRAIAKDGVVGKYLIEIIPSSPNA